MADTGEKPCETCKFGDFVALKAAGGRICFFCREASGWKPNVGETVNLKYGGVHICKCGKQVINGRFCECERIKVNTEGLE